MEIYITEEHNFSCRHSPLFQGSKIFGRRFFLFWLDQMNQLILWDFLWRIYVFILILAKPNEKYFKVLIIIPHEMQINAIKFLNT